MIEAGRILAHRGLWSTPAEQNSLRAFEAALREGFGIETDVRDADGELVIAHDPPGRGALRCRELVELHRALAPSTTLAINVKACGLAGLVQEEVAARAGDRYFVFDCAVPDLLGYRRAGLRFYTRHSDLEPVPPLYAEAAGVWLDELERPWVDAAAIRHHLDLGKEVALVSPELHGRPLEPGWSELARALAGAPLGRLSLCTDVPREARDRFAV